MLNAQQLKMVQSLTLTEAYIQLKLLPSLVYGYSYQCSYFAKKKAKMMEPYEKNMLFMDPVCDSFPFYKRTVQSRTGTEITRQTALSSFLGRSHVNTWKEMYGERYELIPVRVRPGLMYLPYPVQRHMTPLLLVGTWKGLCRGSPVHFV